MNEAMNEAQALVAGRLEDKWIEFVAAEFASRRGPALRQALAARQAACTMRRIEVHASFMWLLAGAAVAWLIA